MMRAMAHIHHEPGQHDLTTSALIIRTDGKEPRVILHMHRKLHKWLHFGGHVELHETPWAAIIHEIKEESGYELSQLHLLQPRHAVTDFGDTSVSHPLPFVLGTHPFGTDEHYHTDITYLFTTDEKPRHKVSGDESNTFRLFTRREIELLPPEQMYHNMVVMVQYAFDHLLSDWKTVDPSKYHTSSTTS
jgi:8-oxo-dGTP pyrophosphatase MutT (NUDIX family)